MIMVFLNLILQMEKPAFIASERREWNLSEKEYYNELVLQAYYHKLFDEEIEKKVLKPLKASIINTFTGFIGGSYGGYTFMDDNYKVKVTINIEKEKIKGDEF